MGGTRQSFLFFLNNSLPSAMVMALGKAGKRVGAPFLSFTECSDHCTRQTDQNQFFYSFFTFHHDKHKLSHISHIHPNIHHIFITSIAYITFITIYHIYHIHQSKHLSHISQLSKYTTSAWQVYQKSITKWTTNANTTNATHHQGGNWVPGEGKAGSVGDAWAGLFEPSDWGSTKEKILHALDKITWIANLGHTNKAQAKTHSCSCRSQRWSEQPRWHS